MPQLKKGDKVICIDDYFEDSETNPFRVSELKLPKERETYTIRELAKTAYGTGVRLNEIINKKYYFGDIHKEEEPIFGINRFQVLDKN